jgi:tetratricopeptide (TPR) repeat protein
MTKVFGKLTLLWFLAVALFFVSFRVDGQEDYAARYKRLSDQHADAQIEPLLNQWREKKPNDPDAWITSANYYFNQGQVMISTKRPDKSDFSLNNAKTGKPAGSISFEQDETAAKHAAEILQEATTKFPDRLDIWCGLAFIQQESGNFDAELSTLKNMVGYARDHSTELKWLKGEKLPEPPGQFIPKKLHSYGLYYEKKENPEDDKRFSQIAMLGAEQFPNHPYAFNDVALYYSVSGDNAKAREWLEKANKIDPKDTLVMANLGHICSKMGDDRGAQKWYEEVIKTDPDGETAQQAKDALKKLKAR